jgi:hypothetical protein
MCNILSEAAAFSIEVSPQIEMLLPDGPSVGCAECPAPCPEKHDGKPLSIIYYMQSKPGYGVPSAHFFAAFTMIP